jgi:hypothetical protein
VAGSLGLSLFTSPIVVGLFLSVSLSRCLFVNHFPLTTAGEVHSGTYAFLARFAVQLGTPSVARDTFKLAVEHGKLSNAMVNVFLNSYVERGWFHRCCCSSSVSFPLSSSSSSSSSSFSSFPVHFIHLLTIVRWFVCFFCFFVGEQSDAESGDTNVQATAESDVVLAELVAGLREAVRGKLTLDKQSVYVRGLGLFLCVCFFDKLMSVSPPSSCSFLCRVVSSAFLSLFLSCGS